MTAAGTRRRPPSAGHPSSRPARPGQGGTALVGSLAGVAVFLVLLLFAVQILVSLYATSTINAAGYDAARTVAARDVDHQDAGSVAAAQARAEAQLRALLGAIGDDADLTWSLDATTVRLRLRVDAPTFLPRAAAGPLETGHVDRTFVVRIEDVS